MKYLNIGVGLYISPLQVAIARERLIYHLQAKPTYINCGMVAAIDWKSPPFPLPPPPSLPNSSPSPPLPRQLSSLPPTLFPPHHPSSPLPRPLSHHHTQRDCRWKLP